LRITLNERLKPLAFKSVRQPPLVTFSVADKSFARLGAPIWFSRNEEIFGEGEPAAYLYEIKSGCIRTYKTLNDGRRRIDAFYIPGDCFGLEVRDDHNVSAEAITRCKTHVIEKKALMARADTDIAIINHLLALTAKELQRAQNHNLLLLKTAQERVVGFLLDMAERQRSQCEINLPMTRGDIADYLGLTIETVSRMLWKLESISAISIPKRRRVILRNLPALQEFNA
jgi:CRP/FNR family transcriptional regulator, nitrogen fixation regulation protein